MGDGTAIEWTDATWNPIRGCSRVSEGCRNCYAETVAARFSGPGHPYHGLARRVTRPDGTSEARWTGKIAVIDTAMTQPMRWTRPRRIFVNSMSDLFHEDVPDEVIDRVFAVMALAPQHVFQVLTKRPERMRQYLVATFEDGAVERRDLITTAALDWRDANPDANEEYRYTDNDCFIQPSRWPLPNVWLGVSVEDQATANERIPALLETPAAVRFISAEPLLGSVDLTRLFHTPLDMAGGLNWVIVGGESGTGARPMHPDWARSLRDQCAAAGVPFFFKQWGEWEPRNQWMRGVAGARMVAIRADGSDCDDYADTFEPDGQRFERVGKSRAGRLLDGMEHNAMPAPPQEGGR